MSKKARSKIAKKETKSKKTVSPAPTPTPEPVCAPAPEPVSEEPPVDEIRKPVSTKRSVIDWIRRKWWSIRVYGQL